MLNQISDLEHALQYIEKHKLMKVLSKAAKASNLQFESYYIIQSKFDFPKISNLAFDIDYLYSCDGYLPSFIFNLEYKVPKRIKIENFELNENGIIRLQTCFEMEKFNLVRYTEFEEHAA